MKSKQLPPLHHEHRTQPTSFYNDGLGTGCFLGCPRHFTMTAWEQATSWDGERVMMEVEILR
jgi:hypothetical protein